MYLIGAGSLAFADDAMKNELGGDEGSNEGRREGQKEEMKSKKKAYREEAKAK